MDRRIASDINRAADNAGLWLAPETTCNRRGIFLDHQVQLVAAQEIDEVIGVHIRNGENLLLHRDCHG